MIGIRFSIVKMLMWMTLATLYSPNGFSTTIVPFENLGQLSISAMCVVVARATGNFEFQEGSQTLYRSRFRISEVLKGPVSVGQEIVTQKWEMRDGENYRVMFGDLNFEKGHTYLLFMTQLDNGLYHPICFSYYVLKEIFVDLQSIWQPSPQQAEFHLTTDKNIEPLYYYDRDKLIQHLSEVISGVTSWNVDEVKTQLPISHIGDDVKRQSPGHCSFLNSGTTAFRWLDFPQLPVAIHYQSGGDPGCASSINLIQQSIVSLNQAYEGINLVDAGTFSGYVPSCGSGVQGTNYLSYIQSQWGSSRHTLVQFNDPCNAIPDLSSCSGTLAVGGLYGVGSHIYDGESWFTGAYGYVVVNNGVGQCMCSSATYGSMIAHELSHTLGIGHISSSSGIANMNPQCCNDIGNLDLACVNYTYESSGALPVDLVLFEAQGRDMYNEIYWETSTETNVERFTIERAINEQLTEFKEITEHLPVEGEQIHKKYKAVDRFPLPVSYYRLKVTDFDGSIQYSNLTVVERGKRLQAELYPTITPDRFFVTLPDETIDQNVELSIISPKGQTVLHQTLSGNIFQLDISNLPFGLYYVTLIYHGQTETLKITKS